MIARIRPPGLGWVTIEVNPAGTRRNSRDERVKLYAWTCSAFLGQHGDPFGTLEADNIGQAYEKAHAIVTGRLRRKLAYEEFHERGPDQMRCGGP